MAAPATTTEDVFRGRKADKSKKDKKDNVNRLLRLALVQHYQLKKKEQVLKK